MDEQVGGMLRANVAGRDLFVDEDGAIVGRRDDATIRVDHELVSRSHAVLRRTGPAWVLVDLGSSNGTFVDGVRVERIEITSTVAVRLGDPDTGALVEFHAPVLEPVLTPVLAPPRAAGTLSEIYRP
jgi:pSer/pThr/pTyr-binding forkhead associated (FHA) protein